MTHPDPLAKELEETWLEAYSHLPRHLAERVSKINQRVVSELVALKKPVEEEEIDDHIADLEQFLGAYPIDIFPEATSKQIDACPENVPGRISAMMGRHLGKTYVKPTVALLRRLSADKARMESELAKAKADRERMETALRKNASLLCEHQIYRSECCPACIARAALSPTDSTNTR